ncbi:MAG: MotA/TolQ/ExbB proton channel family protein [Cellvibrio sp.]|nr:MotA/TolQ/ExbB proton channel family protein [Cellvibrio sp.]
MDLSSEYYWLKSIVVWAIFLMAFITYAILLNLCFFLKMDKAWYEKSSFWYGPLKDMLSSLPLLGLLGTITGLLDTFFRMSVEKSFAIQEIISGGIAEALFTTELGLVTVIPGLLMLNYLQRKKTKWEIKLANEIVN